MIKPGIKIKLGKYPGLNAATPNKQPLAISATVAPYDETFSEVLFSGDENKSEVESRTKPIIQPSSVIAPNSYVALKEPQIKNKSEVANESRPRPRNIDLLLSGFSRR